MNSDLNICSKYQYEYFGLCVYVVFDVDKVNDLYVGVQMQVDEFKRQCCYGLYGNGQSVFCVYCRVDIIVFERFLLKGEKKDFLEVFNLGFGLVLRCWQVLKNKMMIRCD